MGSAPELVAGKGPGAGPHCQRGPHQPLTSALGRALPPSPEEKHAGIVALSPAKQQYQICKKPQCSRKGLQLPPQTREGEAERMILCLPCTAIFPSKNLRWFPSCLAALWGSPALPILPASQGPAHAPGERRGRGTSREPRERCSGFQPGAPRALLLHRLRSILRRSTPIPGGGSGSFHRTSQSRAAETSLTSLKTPADVYFMINK